MRRFLAGWWLIGLLAGAAWAQPLTIYTEISPPDEYLDGEGRLTGYFIEVVREIQKRVGSSEPIELVPWVRGYHEALTKPNVVLFSLARTEQRKELFEWVGPLREASYSFYVRADSRIPLRTLEEARRLRLIGVYKEDVRDQYLSRLGFRNLDRSIDAGIIFKKLLDGRIDAVASEAEGLELLASAGGFKAEDVREALPFLKVQLFIALSRGTPRATQKSWSGALEAMRTEGLLEQLHRKYHPNRLLPAATP